MRNPHAALLLAVMLLPGVAGADAFSDAGVDGAFVLYRVKSDSMTVLHPDRAAERWLPASTFKIPNALIGLETGAIDPARSLMKWDGKDRGRPAVNRDHDLASAIRDSVLWYFQEVARRVGPERMRRLVTAFGYGDMNVPRRPPIDKFWIDASLRISPLEQVAFLRKLRALALPVERRHQELVARLLELDRRRDRVLRGKTGTGFQDGRAVAWLVGWVDGGEEAAVYALLVLAPPGKVDDLMALRRSMLDRLLVEHGVWPAAAN